MVTYAGIGTRHISEDIRNRLYRLGYILAKNQYILHTGAATGSDQAFAEGAIAAGGKVILFLPWRNYESEWVRQFGKLATVKVLDKTDFIAIRSVKQFHPKYTQLSEAAKKLHARNYLIINSCSFVLTYRRLDKKGGTEQGIRIAKYFNIPVFDLSEHTIKMKDIKTALSKAIWTL